MTKKNNAKSAGSLIGRNDGRSDFRRSLGRFTQRNSATTVHRGVHFWCGIEPMKCVVETFQRLLNVLFKPFHSERLQRHSEAEDAATDPRFTAALGPLTVLLTWLVHTLLHHVLQTPRQPPES